MGKTFANGVKFFNIVLASLLIGLSVYSIILLAPLYSITDLQFFNFFTPFFLILLGLLLIGAELKAEIIIKYFKFLHTFLGRGVFNIYLASIAIYIFDAGSAAGWIFGSILFISGLFYIGLHFVKPPEEAFGSEYSAVSA